MYQKHSTDALNKSSTPGLLGAQVIYIHAEPFGYSKMIEQGEVVEAFEHRGETHIKVKPANPRLMAKWRTAAHIQSYLWQLPAAGAQ